MTTDFTQTRQFFDLSPGEIRLDAHARGPEPSAMALADSAKLTDAVLREGIRDVIARLITADASALWLTDDVPGTSFDVLQHALSLRPDRHVILSTTGTLPSLFRRQPCFRNRLPADSVFGIVAPDAVDGRIGQDVAVVFLNHVASQTAKRHCMEEISDLCHQEGALLIWDLTSSAGVLELDVKEAGVDMAIGRGSGFLNGGPHAFGYGYVSPDLQSGMAEMEPEPRAAPRDALVTQHAGLSVWSIADPRDVARRGRQLLTLLADLLHAHCPTLRLVGPRDESVRGAHLCFRHGDAAGVHSKLMAEGVYSELAGGDTLQFAISPLYLDDMDIGRACRIIEAATD